MKVRMKVDVSGTRNGRDWPRRGEIADLPNAEAVDMINAGMADPVTGKGAKGDVETATAPADEETRAAPRKRSPIRAKATVGKAQPADKPAE